MYESLLGKSSSSELHLGMTPTRSVLSTSKGKIKGNHKETQIV